MTDNEFQIFFDTLSIIPVLARLLLFTCQAAMTTFEFVLETFTSVTFATFGPSTVTFHLTLTSELDSSVTAWRKVVVFLRSASVPVKGVVDTGQTGCGHTLNKECQI